MGSFIVVWFLLEGKIVKEREGEIKGDGERSRGRIVPYTYVCVSVLAALSHLAQLCVVWVKRDLAGAVTLAGVPKGAVGPVTWLELLRLRPVDMVLAGAWLNLAREVLASIVPLGAARRATLPRYRVLSGIISGPVY